MFARALVGVDLSEPSAAVLSCLPNLAPAGLREIVLGHVIYVANTPGLDYVAGLGKSSTGFGGCEAAAGRLFGNHRYSLGCARCCAR